MRTEDSQRVETPSRGPWWYCRQQTVRETWGLEDYFSRAFCATTVSSRWCCWDRFDQYALQPSISRSPEEGGMRKWRGTHIRRIIIALGVWHTDKCDGCCKSSIREWSCHTGCVGDGSPALLYELEGSQGRVLFTALGGIIPYHNNRQTDRTNYSHCSLHSSDTKQPYGLITALLTSEERKQQYFYYIQIINI